MGKRLSKYYKRNKEIHSGAYIAAITIGKTQYSVICQEFKYGVYDHMGGGGGITWDTDMSGSITFLPFGRTLLRRIYLVGPIRDMHFVQVSLCRGSRG